MRTFFRRARRAVTVHPPLARVTLALALAALLLVRGHTVTIDCMSAFSPAAAFAGGGTAAMPMIDWFANHPVRGENALAAPKDSFTVANFAFNEDGNVSTVVDTAKIVQGDVILWKWVSGIHTVTSGTGSIDPNAGLLFDQPSTTSLRTFSFQFNNVGTFPFFCRNHELSNMRGVVVVSQNLASVGPPAAAGNDGFVLPPWPNPSAGATTVRYALARPGHARLTVLDAQGRSMARLLDADLGAGTFESRWSGRTPSGGAAPAGVYFVRLELAGHASTRRVTLVH